MSRYHGNDERCEVCGMRYADLRTGLTHKEVYHLVFERPNKRRGTVLGAWFEMKQSMWAEHQRTCGAPESEPSPLEASAYVD